MDPDPFEDPDLSFASHARNALLHDLSSWRDQLARSIARNNHGLPSDTISSTANRIIGRLLFLCIAEDRGLIKAGTLQQIHDSGDPLVIVSELLINVSGPLGRSPPKKSFSYILERSGNNRRPRDTKNSRAVVST